MLARSTAAVSAFRRHRPLSRLLAPSASVQSSVAVTLPTGQLAGLPLSAGVDNAVAALSESRLSGLLLCGTAAAVALVSGSMSVECAPKAWNGWAHFSDNTTADAKKPWKCRCCAKTFPPDATLARKHLAFDCTAFAESERTVVPRAPRTCTIWSSAKSWQRQRLPTTSNTGTARTGGSRWGASPSLTRPPACWFTSS